MIRWIILTILAVFGFVLMEWISGEIKSHGFRGAFIKSERECREH